jgi:hypothetical protein
MDKALPNPRSNARSWAVRRHDLPVASHGLGQGGACCSLRILGFGHSCLLGSFYARRGLDTIRKGTAGERGRVRMRIVGSAGLASRWYRTPYSALLSRSRAGLGAHRAKGEGSGRRGRGLSLRSASVGVGEGRVRIQRLSAERNEKEGSDDAEVRKVSTRAGREGARGLCWCWCSHEGFLELLRASYKLRTERRVQHAEAPCRVESIEPWRKGDIGTGTGSVHPASAPYPAAAYTVCREFRIVPYRPCYIQRPSTPSIDKNRAARSARSSKATSRRMPAPPPIGRGRY